MLIVNYCWHNLAVVESAFTRKGHFIYDKCLDIHVQMPALHRAALQTSFWCDYASN